jgi:hypothetical protein
MLRRSSSAAVLTCCLILLPAPAAAQTRADGAARAPKPAPPAASPERAGLDAAAEAERATAVALLGALAGEARHYRDPSLRARALAQTADALWVADQEQARAIFYKAWEAAEAVDKEGLKEIEEARQGFLTGQRRGSGMIPPAPKLRAEVLRLASQRSRELGEELLGRLHDAKEQESASAATPAINDPTEPPYAVERRLELARQLLEAGEVERAGQFAAPALNYTTSQGIIFLVALRQRQPELADRLYMTLLNRAATDPAADATTVSLLSSYVFTPSLLVTATRNGRLSNQWSEAAAPPALPPDFRNAFFRVAAPILLRPLPPPEQDRTAAGRAGTYFTVARLLPLFEQHAPDHVPALRALLATLAADAPEAYRADREGMLTLGLTPSTAAGADPQEILGRLSTYSSPAERDAAHARAARVAALKSDPRAQEYAEKIGNEHLRKRVLGFVQFAAVRDAIKEQRVDEAVRLARAGDFQPLQRVWILTEAARLLTRSSRARAAELLDEAAAEARRLGDGTAERGYALTAVARRLLDVDRARGWEVTAEAVKAVNQVAWFTGSETKVEARLQTSDQVTTLKVDVPAFELSGVFAALAADDLLRAITLAKTFEGESPRASALIAVARAALERRRERASR